MRAKSKKIASRMLRAPRRGFAAGLVPATVALLLLVASVPSRAQTTPLDPPDLYCYEFYSDVLVLQICGGGWGGAPGGFVVDWQLQSDYELYGWPDGGAAPSPSFCEATFTGPEYQLGMHECIELQFGKNPFDTPGVSSTCTDAAPLACNTEYVFRSKALATPNMTQSGWIGNLRCSTDYNCDNPGPTPPPGGTAGCTYTLGYWKNHADAWPVTSLTLGTVAYNQTQLLRILRQPVRGNGLVSLAHQLIAAKLNVANGATSTEVADAISDADALIGDLVVPPIGDGHLRPRDTSSLNDTLASFNEGEIGPGHCED